MKSLSHYFQYPEMAGIWSKENQHKTYSEIEDYACEALVSLGQMEKDEKNEMNDEEELQQIIKHYPFDLLKNPAAQKTYSHPGLLSANLLDTTLSLLMKRSASILLKDLEKLQIILKEKAFEHKYSYMLSRLHGRTSPLITFGLKMANWHQIIERSRMRLTQAQEVISFGTLSGLSGTFSHLSPHVEENVCKKLDLQSDPASYQFLDRDRHSEFLSTLALIGKNIKQFAEELYQLQRIEIQEVEEPKSHDFFFLTSESHLICEQMRELSTTICHEATSFALKTNWYERTLGGTQSENHIIANSCILLDFILQTFTQLLKELVIDKEKMYANIEKTKGFVYVHDLVAMLMNHGLSHLQAQSTLKPFLEHCQSKGLHLIDYLSKDKEFSEYIPKETLEKNLNLEEYFKNVDFIFNRVFTNQ